MCTPMATWGLAMFFALYMHEARCKSSILYGGVEARSCVVYAMLNVGDTNGERAPAIVSGDVRPSESPPHWCDKFCFAWSRKTLGIFRMSLTWATWHVYPSWFICCLSVIRRVYFVIPNRSAINVFWVLTTKALPRIVFAVAWPCKLFTYSLLPFVVVVKESSSSLLPFHVLTLMACVASIVPCDEQSVWLNLWADVIDENH